MYAKKIFWGGKFDFCKKKRWFFLLSTASVQSRPPGPPLVPGVFVTGKVTFCYDSTEKEADDFCYKRTDGTKFSFDLFSLFSMRSIVETYSILYKKNTMKFSNICSLYGLYLCFVFQFTVFDHILLSILAYLYDMIYIPYVFPFPIYLYDHIWYYLFFISFYEITNELICIFPLCLTTWYYLLSKHMTSQYKWPYGIILSPFIWLFHIIATLGPI